MGKFLSYFLSSFCFIISFKFHWLVDEYKVKYFAFLPIAVLYHLAVTTVVLWPLTYASIFLAMWTFRLHSCKQRRYQLATQIEYFSLSTSHTFIVLFVSFFSDSLSTLKLGFEYKNHSFHAPSIRGYDGGRNIFGDANGNEKE